MDSRRLKYLSWFGALLIISSVTRLAVLGLIPAGREGAFFARLPTATAGIISIAVLVLFIWKVFKRPDVGLVSGYCLALMPWHIEQSRVVSTPMLGLAVGMTTLYMTQIFRDRLVKGLILVLGLGLFYFLYRDFWLFSIGTIIKPHDFLTNVFKLASVDFLFYRNDTFWEGGLRTIGVLLPGFIGLAGIGLVEIIRKWNKKYWFYYLGFIFLLVLSAANPKLPEAREYFLVTPYLSIICALGAIKLYRLLFNSKKAIRLFIFMYLMFIAYEHIWFYHMYSYHYAQRVKNEVPYEKLTF